MTAVVVDVLAVGEDGRGELVASVAEPEADAFDDDSTRPRGRGARPFPGVSAGA